MKRFIILLLVFLTVTGCSAKQTSFNEEHYQLKNGLSVILRPIEGTRLVALITLFSIGEDHDPKGKSGMGHLIEHLYVTSAAGTVESRNIQAFISQYPDGWNAQTGKNYTIIAAVFPKERIGSELKDAAARMSKLDIKDSDLKREIPRIENELSNMYGGIPALAAQNLASDIVAAHHQGARKGGIINQIKSIDIKDIYKRIQKFYKPKNAMLVIAGAINPEQIRKTINKAFSGIERGQEVEAVPLFLKLPSIMEKNKKVYPRFPQAQSHVSLAFRTPNPSDKLFPAFLVIVARLQSNSFKLNPPKGVFPVGFALLDRPEVVTLHLPVPKGEKADTVVDKLRKYVSATTSEKLKRKDITNTKQVFGYMLGLQEYSDRVLVNNIYGVAFSLGMRKQLGIDSQKLIEKLNSVTQDELTEAVKKYFALGNYATAVVQVDK
jgi:zinc protease